ncbi:hypothetical protein PVAP13_5NG189162 [Panicum virgatum]|uniref:Uncharacterized protein n=1 Tax=Panicum virgatum TaxID=38727 RepID=A0A8T0RNR3_PANVG|nr:hypothetical protein PVAP13_5NG189162 [Panicum virgatum]
MRKCCRQHRGTYPPGVPDVLGAVRGGWWVGAVAGVVAGGRGGGGRRALGIRVPEGAEVHRCSRIRRRWRFIRRRWARGCDSAPGRAGRGGAGRDGTGGGRRRWQASRRGRVGTYPYADGNRVRRVCASGGGDR